MPMTPEETKAYKKAYYQKNKEKIKEKEKEYREKNKEKIKEKEKEYKKEYREKNKEKTKEKEKEYYQKNKEQRKEYRQTEQCKKTHRISNWKKRGVKCDDFASLYEYYLNCKNCEDCNIELAEGIYGANKRCLDHSHNTGLFRNILCNTCNLKRRENNILK